MQGDLFIDQAIAIVRSPDLLGFRPDVLGRPARADISPGPFPEAEGCVGLCTPPTLPVRIPCRLQRSRKRGARTPPGAIWAGRPTILANPFNFERFGHARSCLMYDKWFEGSLSDLELERWSFCPAEIDALHRLRERVQRRLPMLRGKDLVCWCPLTSKWCHVNTLIRGANEHIPPQMWFQ